VSRRSTAVIGVDIGGTNIKIALVDPAEKRFLERSRLKTSADRGPEAILVELGGSLARLNRRAMDRGFRVVGVGVGSAGVIDLNEG
jgi:glucokinase